MRVVVADRTRVIHKQYSSDSFGVFAQTENELCKIKVVVVLQMMVCARACLYILERTQECSGMAFLSHPLVCLVFSPSRSLLFGLLFLTFFSLQ